ncbi:MAG: protein-export chaperone SecB [Pseudoalteromonas prydzensis]|uniref:protein-export chaperone SecB n=1 Tax=Pseudoalteromonas prydzensis TaxID=182141 RepID=UPI003F96E7FE
MSIQFIGGRMTLLEIHASPSIFSDFANSKDNESGVEEFSVSSAFSDNNDDHYYQVEFRMKIVSSDGALVNFKYLANFYREENIDEDFKKSPFVYVNSPAIAYPYLRASVSSVLINSGLANIILPTINFQAMYNEEIKPNLE